MNKQSIQLSASVHAGFDRVLGLVLWRHPSVLCSTSPYNQVRFLRMRKKYSHARLDRLQDFRRRTEYAPKDVYRHRALSCEYIPVHPFGDEAAILRRLGLAPVDCHSADCWVCVDEEVTLLSCIVDEGAIAPRYFAKANMSGPLCTYLDAVVPGRYVKRSDVEEAIEFFVRAGFPDHKRFRVKRADGRVLVGPSGT
jgi:hypothetical protein